MEGGWEGEGNPHDEANYMHTVFCLEIGLGGNNKTKDVDFIEWVEHLMLRAAPPP